MNDHQRPPSLVSSPLLAGTLLLATAAASPGAGLPQAHAWQITLRDYLADIEEADVRIDKTTWELTEDYQAAGVEKLYRDWIVLGHTGRLPTDAMLRAAPRHFLLRQIEAAQIRVFPEPAAAAWWVQLDIKGNPYRHNDAARRRAVVIAIVDMIMLESAQIADPRNRKPDFMGANLGTWAYTYHHAHGVMPAKVQAAYRAGMLHYLRSMERLAPRDGNTNMDMRELATLAELDVILGADPAMHQRLVETARRILFGRADRTPATSDPRRGCFHPGGYIGEADGPEASYNGISLYHLLETAMLTRGRPDWDAFMPEVIHRMLRFKAHNSFPQPDGTLEGPSSWAKRTNNPYPRDQRDRYWREIAAAMLSPHGLYLLRVDPTRYDGTAFGYAAPETMLADIRQGVARLNRAPRKPERWDADAAPVWQERHWPADLPYTWDAYVPGSYARFGELIRANSELLRPPFARPGDFSRNFDGEFWVAKRGDWGFMVEAVPHMGRGYSAGGSGALAGGSLATFWTRPTGVIVLGRLPAKWNYVTWDTFEQWPTHHLWGRTPDGVRFSSARQWDPWVSFELDAAPPAVHVFGHFGVEPGRKLDADHVAYRRRFEMLDTGLRVTSEVLSRGTAQAVELWESLPIFVHGSGPRRRKNPDSTIDFRVGQRWVSATPKLTEGVTAIRAARFGGGVRIEFDTPQRVALAPEPVTTKYQTKDKLQNVRIDLLGSGGQAAAIPNRAVSYVLRADQEKR